MTTQIVDRSASLDLLRDRHGTLLVRVRRQPHRVHTLSNVYRYGQVDGYLLYHSQRETVDMWFNSASADELRDD